MLYAGSAFRICLQRACPARPCAPAGFWRCSALVPPSVSGRVLRGLSGLLRAPSRGRRVQPLPGAQSRKIRQNPLPSGEHVVCRPLGGWRFAPPSRACALPSARDCAGAGLPPSAVGHLGGWLARPVRRAPLFSRAGFGRLRGGLFACGRDSRRLGRPSRGLAANQSPQMASAPAPPQSARPSRLPGPLWRDFGLLGRSRARCSLNNHKIRLTEIWRFSARQRAKIARFLPVEHSQKSLQCPCPLTPYLCPSLSPLYTLSESTPKIWRSGKDALPLPPASGNVPAGLKYILYGVL